MFPDPLDEYPIHQVPLSMARTATSDRNFYDRYYFNAHDTTGDIYVVSGFGVYPNLGVVDAFATAVRGTDQRAVRFSDALDTRCPDRVGEYRVEVIEPLERLRVVCEHPDLSFDLTWAGSFRAVLEERHLLMSGPRPNLDASRFAQLGTWEGTLCVDGEDFAVDPAQWMGSRDRSWGIRPSGDPDPLGRMEELRPHGFWWVYCPLRFDDFAIILIAQEDSEGFRTLNYAVRVDRGGAVEQLGWPRFEVDYATGTREMVSARIHLTDRCGGQSVIELEPKTTLTLQIGAGYGSDPEWSHGRWMGHRWSLSSRYDTADPEFAVRKATGIVEYLVHARYGGATGAGMFEHGNVGRHTPSGFHSPYDVAP